MRKKGKRGKREEKEGKGKKKREKGRKREKGVKKRETYFVSLFKKKSLQKQGRISTKNSSGERFSNGHNI